MFKLVVLTALLAIAAAKPTTLISSPALATAPLAYASYAAPIAYTNGLTYSAGYAAPAFYRPGLAAAPLAYDYAPLAYIN